MNWKHHTLAQTHQIHPWRHTSTEHVCTMCVWPLISASTDAVQKASQQRPQPARSTASLAARPCCAEETAPCNTNNPSATAAQQLWLLIPVPPCKVQNCNTHTALGNGCPSPPTPGFNIAFHSDEIFKSIVSQGPFHSGICPKYCCAHLLGGDSDDSIKHMNGESCHADVAEHWRLMILNQRGALLTGIVEVPAEQLQLLICLRMALYDFKGTITVRWRDVFLFSDCILPACTVCGKVR